MNKYSSLLEKMGSSGTTNKTFALCVPLWERSMIFTKLGFHLSSSSCNENKSLYTFVNTYTLHSWDSPGGSLSSSYIDSSYLRSESRLQTNKNNHDFLKQSLVEIKQDGFKFKNLQFWGTFQEKPDSCLRWSGKAIKSLQSWSMILRSWSLLSIPKQQFACMVRTRFISLLGSQSPPKYAVFKNLILSPIRKTKGSLLMKLRTSWSWYPEYLIREAYQYL